MSTVISVDLSKLPQGLSGLPTMIPDDEVDPQLWSLLSDAKTNITLASPLIAYMMFRCTFKFTDQKDIIDIAAALPWEGKNYIFIDVDAFVKQFHSTEQRAYLIYHEVLHIFLEHSGRAMENGYDPDLHNMACDYYINLVGAGAYKAEDNEVRYNKRFQLYLARPEIGLYDEQYIGLSSDEIYHLLKQKHKSAKKAVAAIVGAGGRPVDGIADVSPTSGQLIDNRQAASAAAAFAGNMGNGVGIGENEGDMARRLAEMSKPVVVWQDELNVTIARSTKERPTYTRLSRRTGMGGVVFPSRTGMSINGIFGFDSSGSMSMGDYSDVAAECNNIVNQFESWSMDLLSCDTRAHLLGRYSSEDGDSFGSMNMQAIGLSGTEMSPMIRYAIEQAEDGVEVNFCIIVTDGHIPTTPVEDAARDAMLHDIPVIVVVTRNGNRGLALNNAKVIHMTDS